MNSQMAPQMEKEQSILISQIVHVVTVIMLIMDEPLKSNSLNINDCMHMSRKYRKWKKPAQHTTLTYLLCYDAT